MHLSKQFIKSPNPYELVPEQSDSKSDPAVLVVTHLNDINLLATDSKDVMLFGKATDFGSNNLYLPSTCFTATILPL